MTGATAASLDHTRRLLDAPPVEPVPGQLAVVDAPAPPTPPAATVPARTRPYSTAA
ncbi:hypothetical protein [Streptomyces celluloflavus]|uniref:hypothetical protein n=1 Tax=Streptomyces celluloflavus TaxID=58344 RepID=UPI00365E5C33